MLCWLEVYDRRSEWMAGMWMCYDAMSSESDEEEMGEGMVAWCCITVFRCRYWLGLRTCTKTAVISDAMKNEAIPSCTVRLVENKRRSIRW